MSAVAVVAVARAGVVSGRSEDVGGQCGGRGQGGATMYTDSSLTVTRSHTQASWGDATLSGSPHMAPSSTVPRSALEIAHTNQLLTCCS